MQAEHFAQRYLERRYILDRVLAGVCILVAAPVMLGWMVWVWLCDRAPVFYFARRLDQQGEFLLLPKLRTFKNTHDEQAFERTEDGRHNSATSHPDLLHGAALLRRLGIDELPQLLLVITGDVALIGPRPLPEDLAELQLARPTWLRVGITGLAQVNGRRDATMQQRLYWDLEYSYRATWKMDLWIVSQTVKAIWTME